MRQRRKLPSSGLRELKVVRWSGRKEPSSTARKENLASHQASGRTSLGFPSEYAQVDTVWFGVKVGIGIVIGMALIRFVWREIRGFALPRQFTKRGCTYQHEGGSESHPN